MKTFNQIIKFFEEFEFYDGVMITRSKPRLALFIVLYSAVVVGLIIIG
jgi:hypothetical protein